MQASIIGDLAARIVRRDAPSRPERKNLLAGRKGKGAINIRSLFVEFSSDGRTVSAYTTRNDTEKPYVGTYTLRGKSIRMVLGPSVLVGTVEGDRISGSRERSDGIRDTWYVNLDR